ncbi:unnamed protein product [Peronospora effusa]|nr:unnamed protein product [Peronospora effusa]
MILPAEAKREREDVPGGRLEKRKQLKVKGPSILSFFVREEVTDVLGNRNCKNSIMTFVIVMLEVINFTLIQAKEE